MKQKARVSVSFINMDSYYYYCKETTTVDVLREMPQREKLISKRINSWGMQLHSGLFYTTLGRKAAPQLE